MAYSREIEKLERRWKENPQGTSFAPYAEALRKDRQPELAQEVLRQGLELHPDHIPANIVLGRCCLDLKQDGEAETAFAKVLELDQENVIALKAMAEITERQSRYAEADQWLQRLIAVDPSNDEAREQLGRLNAMREQAAADLVSQLAITSTPDVQVAQGTVPEDQEDTLVVAAVKTPAAPATAPREPEPIAATLLLPPEEVETVPIPAVGTKLSTPVDTTRVLEPVPPPEPEPMVSEPEPEITGFVAGELDVRRMSAQIQPQAIPGMVLEEEGPTAMPISEVEPEPAPPVGARAGVDIGVEVPEDIVLSSSGGSEYQTPSDSELLASGTDASAFGAELPMPEPEPEPVFVDSSPTAGLPLIFPEEVAAPPAAPEAIEPSIAEPEPVVTETMAELYASQGHRDQALKVYRELAERTPGDPRLQDKVSQLERAEVGAGEIITEQWATYAASVTGGQSVAAFFEAVLASRLGPPGAAGQGSFSAPVRHDAGAGEADQGAGAPTRPAQDRLSLSAIFGEEAAPSATAAGPDHPPAPRPSAGAFSFDQFFGGAKTPPGSASGSPTTKSGGLEEDLDQFQNWLKSLKR